VAEILRDAITTGQLQPGQRLTEMELSAQLGTSRAPIREALRQLEQEGLVVSQPYRGTEVLGVSQEEIEEILIPIRITLERFAFRKAAVLLSEKDFSALETIVASMAEAADTGDLVQLADEDVRFHETVIIASRQQHCLQIWRTLQPRVRAYFRRDAGYYEDTSLIAAQHRDLIAVLRTGDGDRVGDAITEHVRTHFSADGHRS
jgi:DNA-binding GntR family transcriptional regulator